MNQFKSCFDFQNFRDEVVRKRRYVLTHESQAFLQTVCATAHNRPYILATGTELHRSQLGCDWRPDRVDPSDPKSEIVSSPVAFSPERMKPLMHSASDGRVNPRGIPCLYLSDDPETCMAEVRPWPDSLISVGTFVILRDVTLVNCCDEEDKFLDLVFKEYKEKLKREELESVAWSEISSAFSLPVTPSDKTAHYVATQIISEALSADGFDGIRYKSHLGTGFNVALFDLDSAVLQRCRVYWTEKVAFTFRSKLAAENYALVNGDQVFNYE